MKKIIKATLVVAVIGSTLGAVNIASCKGCHGLHFEKKALGVSKIVKDMNSTEITNALVGYKNGTFGGSMKGIMKGQVKKLSAKDIVQVSKQISESK